MTASTSSPSRGPAKDRAKEDTSINTITEMHANDAAEEDGITRTPTRRLAQELAERDDNTGNLTGMIAEGDTSTKNLTREDNISETLTGAEFIFVPKKNFLAD